MIFALVPYPGLKIDAKGRVTARTALFRLGFTNKVANRMVDTITNGDPVMVKIELPDFDIVMPRREERLRDRQRQKRIEKNVGLLGTIPYLKIKAVDGLEFIDSK